MYWVLHDDCRICCWGFCLDIFGAVHVSHWQMSAEHFKQPCVCTHACVYLFQFSCIHSAQFLPVLWGSRLTSSPWHTLPRSRKPMAELQTCNLGSTVLQHGDILYWKLHKRVLWQLHIKCPFFSLNESDWRNVSRKPVLPLLD